MSTMTVRLPALAQHEGISINQFLLVAAAEKMSALMTEDFLASEAKKGNRKAFERILKKVPDVDPESEDKL